jgi:hypothetical protein
MKKFPFGEIIKDAWKTIIHNTKLWWFGIFVGTGISVTIPDFSGYGGGGVGGGVDMGSFTKTLQDIMDNWVIVLVGIAFVALFLVVFFFIILICQSAILHGFVKVKNGEAYKFWNLVGLGIKKVGRLFWMAIIYVAPNLVLLGIALLAFPWSNFSLGGIRWWLIIPIVCILVLYNLFVALFRHYSYCFAVIENQSGWQAIKSGFCLMKKNFGNVFVVGLIYIGLSMAATIGMVITLLILCLPFVLLFVLAIFMAKWLIIVVISLGVIVLLTIALALRGAIGAYFQSYFTNAYWELKK